MIGLKFSARLLTCQEMFWIERSMEGTAVTECIQFIAARAEGVEDVGALLRLLFNLPYPEMVRLFNEAARAAYPATRDAVDAVKEEFRKRDEAEAEDDIDRLFADDLIG